MSHGWKVCIGGRKSPPHRPAWVVKIYAIRKLSLSLPRKILGSPAVALASPRQTVNLLIVPPSEYGNRSDDDRTPLNYSRHADC